MWDDLLGALSGVSLSLDKSAYRVGEKPLYKVTGGVPGSQIAWTSYKNGQSTGEYQSFYGSYLDGYGNATLPATQEWKDTDIGTWRKDVVIIPPDYPSRPVENATVNFTVSGQQTSLPNTSQPSVNSGGGGISSIFEGDVELPVVGSVPKPVLIGAAVLGVLILTQSGGSGSGRR